MDSTSRKRVKFGKKSNHKRSDMISSLPDSILNHILSFLPTIYAVRTSVLSKSWKDLWTFITQLHFNDREPHGNKIRKNRFLDSVDRVLQLNTSSIQSFSLSLSKSYDSYQVDQWIYVILSRRVRKLCIESMQNLYISSHSLWKSPSIEELVLKMNGCGIVLPTFVRLSSLTVLSLSGITFSCSRFNALRKLRLNFPVLRKYEAENCTWSNFQGVTFQVPLLEVLSIKHTDERVSTTSHRSHTRIKFCASRLTEFSYCGFVSADTNLLHLSATRIASANINAWNYGQETTLFGYEFMKKFNNKVECLKFHYPEVLAPVRKSLRDLPDFEMLSRLELEVVTGKMLLLLLMKAPFLHTLIISKELLDFAKKHSGPGVVPSCFISNLEVVNFRGLKGVEHELRFIKYVIENAEVLKRASFTAVRDLRGSNFEKVKEKIFSFKRRASFAFIDFSSFL